jgi:hypothetical protein
MGSMLDREKRPIPNVLTDGLIPENLVQQEGELDYTPIAQCDIVLPCSSVLESIYYITLDRSHSVQ